MTFSTDTTFSFCANSCFDLLPIQMRVKQLRRNQRMKVISIAGVLFGSVCGVIIVKPIHIKTEFVCVRNSQSYNFHLDDKRRETSFHFLCEWKTSIRSSFRRFHENNLIQCWNYLWAKRRLCLSSRFSFASIKLKPLLICSFVDWCRWHHFKCKSISFLCVSFAIEIFIGVDVAAVVVVRQFYHSFQYCRQTGFILVIWFLVYRLLTLRLRSEQTPIGNSLIFRFTMAFPLLRLRISSKIKSIHN